jgi:C-terminal processing protease CtpA/Prc
VGRGDLHADGQPIDEVVSNNVPWSSPFSNPVIKRLQQLRYATRFGLDKGQVEVQFQNAGGGRQTVKLEVVDEFASFSQASFAAGEDPAALPVEFTVLPGGLGYVKISSFIDNDVLSIQVWERAMTYFNENSIPGVIVDMRHNSGGSGWLADQMAAYFFDEELIVGKSAHYDETTGEFYLDPDDEQIMIPPPEELQYAGRVAVLVGPACASACEFFYDTTINDRASSWPVSGGAGA